MKSFNNPFFPPQKANLRLACRTGGIVFRVFRASEAGAKLIHMFDKPLVKYNKTPRLRTVILKNCRAKIRQLSPLHIGTSLA